MLLAFGPGEIVLFLWFMLLMDVPRHLLAALVLAVLPARTLAEGKMPSVCGLVSCHNEESSITVCVESMRANGIEQVVVVNDGSTDATHDVAVALDVILIDLPERIGKPNACNVGLPYCVAELVLVADADTTFAPDSVRRVAQYFEPGVAGVGFDLEVRGDNSLVTRFQAIEYAITFTAGRRIADAFGILPNISGAAGLFRRDALMAVGGWPCEVAEDSALATELRAAGWQLRYAPEAIAVTEVPATMLDLMLQRLRWDASIATIWWFRRRDFLNPFSPRFTASNLFAALDVLVFGALMPLILPFYVLWLWNRIEESSLILLGAVMLALAVLDTVILFLVRAPLRIWPYVPFYLLIETIIMRPLRVVALIAELVFSITRYDPYIPRSQRGRLT